MGLERDSGNVPDCIRINDMMIRERHGVLKLHEMPTASSKKLIVCFQIQSR